MEQTLLIYNTLTRQKEAFKPINPGHVGMYVCGPTVYGDAHLGHARPAITFDILFRYLQHLGYKVRYVRNITDVGHLEHDADEGEDKIAKKARLEQLEPMEIAQYYTRRFNSAMEKLNVLPPSIEPHATGHIIEQQQLVQQILDNGYAYVSNGSVYFDIEKYNKDYKYGILSGRTLENIKDASRDTLAGVGEKKNQADFALWKKAQGMDLVFPHHECEIAQAQASMGHQAVRYWMHNNMITINGQKMGKSYNNFITLDQFFKGEHELLTKPFSPMTIRFFILSAHYRGTVDFSSEALEAAEKGFARLMQGLKDIKRIQTAKGSSPEIEKFVKELPQKLYDAMNDDLQTPIVISELFEACHQVNLLVDRKAKISQADLDKLAETMRLFTVDILGLTNQTGGDSSEKDKALDKVMQMVLEMRAKAKAEKDWATSDKIRDELSAAGIIVKDTPDGAVWEV